VYTLIRRPFKKFHNSRFSTLSDDMAIDTHTCTHTHTLFLYLSHTLSFSHTHTHTLQLTQIFFAHTHTLSFSHTHTSFLSHTHARTHTHHTHTHLHTHTHACTHSLSSSKFSPFFRSNFFYLTVFSSSPSVPSIFIDIFHSVWQSEIIFLPRFFSFKLLLLALLLYLPMRRTFFKLQRSQLWLSKFVLWFLELLLSNNNLIQMWVRKN